MSSSGHPVALDVERRVGGSFKLLATVMALPLVDGLFPALVLAGALTTVTGVLEVGLLVFGGSATVAVILADMDADPRQQVRAVLAVGAIIVPLAVVEAALAPTIRGLVDLAIFQRFAAVVILAIAARTASSRVGEVMPRPAVIVVLGFVASATPGSATLVVDPNPVAMASAAAAAGVGVAFALTVALASRHLRNAVDIDRFRFGSAVALGVLPLGFLGVVPGNPPIALAVLLVTTVLSLDPGRARRAEDRYEPDPVDLTAAFAGLAPGDHVDGDDVELAEPDDGPSPGSGPKPGPGSAGLDGRDGTTADGDPERDDDRTDDDVPFDPRDSTVVPERVPPWR